MSVNNSVQRFECPICLSSFHYVIPKILPCVHTVCEQCLIRLIVDGKAKKFKCPICREDIKVPKGGTKDFRTNIYLIPDDDMPKEKKVCSFCAEESSAFTRQPCGHDICNTCVLQQTSLGQTKYPNLCPVCSNNVPVQHYRTPPRSVPDRPPPPRPPASFRPGQGGRNLGHGIGVPVLPTQAQPTMANPPRIPNTAIWSSITSPAPDYPLEPSAPIYNGDDGYDSMRNVPDPLQGEEWYVGEISRDQSIEILQSRGTGGLFHIRKTIKDDPSHKYTLDIHYGRSDYHLKIKQRPDGRYYVKNDCVSAKHFEDVRSLVEYFRREAFILKDKQTGRDFSLILKV